MITKNLECKSFDNHITALHQGQSQDSLRLISFESFTAFLQSGVISYRRSEVKLDFPEKKNLCIYSLSTYLLWKKRHLVTVNVPKLTISTTVLLH